MPFEIVRNDIVNMQVDAVVNSANPEPVIGSGTDSGIHEKAGGGLLAARKKIGCIAAAITSASTLGFTMRKPLAVTMLLFLCFPVRMVFWIVFAAAMGSWLAGMIRKNGLI